MFLVALVCLSGGLFVDIITKKVINRLGWNFMEVLGTTVKNWLNFGGDMGILRWVNEQKNTIIVVAYPDRGTGYDPKHLSLAFHHQG